MRKPQLLTPEYAKSLARGDQSSILKLSTDDNSGIVCFDQFTQDTWIQLSEADTLPKTTVED